MTGIKNMDMSKVLVLKDEVAYQPGQVVSKTLAQNEHLSVTLFAFDKGEEISTHESGGDAFVTCLDGVGKITIDGVDYELHEGESIVMPAKHPHAVFGKEQFKMLFVVVFYLFLFTMPFQYKVSEDKKVRVIIDTDAACEADDPFAIAHALMCQKFDVRAIFAEQFNREGSTRQSYEEILTVLRAMKKEVPVFMGEETKISEKKQGEEVSPAADFLIEEAMRVDEKPLFVLCIGAITNVASAMMKKKEIAKHMTIVWIGGQGHAYSTPEVREFNAGNDVEAINYVLNSGVNFWQIPNDVYGKMRISLAEIERRIAPCGEIGRHLFENMETYNHSEHAGWTAGESWTLGDSPAVGVVLDPDCGFYHETEAPIILDDTTNKFEKGRPKIRVYTSVDSRFILEDFIAKLEVLYGKGSDTK